MTTVHVFASHDLDTYLVRAETHTEAKGKQWNRDRDVEYLGTVEQVFGQDGDVVKVTV